MKVDSDRVKWFDHNDGQTYDKIRVHKGHWIEYNDLKVVVDDDYAEIMRVRLECSRVSKELAAKIKS